MLSPLKVEKCKPTAKPQKLYDDDGLFLLVSPAGSKTWWFRYKVAGKERKISLGKFPAVGLGDARTARDAARLAIMQGLDPAAPKAAPVVLYQPTFADAFDAYMNQADVRDLAETTRISKGYGFKLCAPLHALPLTSITAGQIVEMLEAVMQPGAGAQRGSQSRNKAWRCVKSVFEYAEVRDLIDRNPCHKVKAGYKMPVRNKALAAITDPLGVGELLRAIFGYRTPQATVAAALRVLPYVFTRPSELRTMQWAHVDLEGAMWIIPTEIMKSRTQPHRVPLSRQVVTMLRTLHAITGAGRYVFAGRGGSEPISNMTMNQALKTLGYGDTHTPHGFRSTASTLLNGMRTADGARRFDPDAIEAQLAHIDPNEIRKIYNRGTHDSERREMMQVWADYLDALRDGGDAASIMHRRTGPANDAEPAGRHMVVA